MSRPRTVPPADAFPNPRPRRTMRNRERQSKRLLRSRAKRTMRNRKRRSKRLLRPRARAGERIRAAPTRQVSIRPHAREHEPRETCNHFLFDRQLSSSNPCNESSCRAEFCPSGLPGSFTPARVTPPRTFSARSASIREAHPPRKASHRHHRTSFPSSRGKGHPRQLRRQNRRHLPTQLEPNPLPSSSAYRP